MKIFQGKKTFQAGSKTLANRLNSRFFLYKEFNTGWSPTDPDAIAYFNSIGDVPVSQQQAIENRILAFKANGTWSGLLLFAPFPQSMTMFGGIRDGRTNTVRFTQQTASTANPSPLYNFPRALPQSNGCTFWGTGNLLSDVTPSVSMTLNSTAWAACYMDTDAASAGFNHGAFNGATQSMIFQKRNASNQQFADMYGSTTTSGRAQATGVDGSGGVFIANRQASNNFKLFKNGVQVASTTADQGSLPSVPWLFNGYKTTTTNGAGSNETLAACCLYGSHLTDSQLTQENTDWQAFITEMRRSAVYDYSLLVDGNSHMVYWNSAFSRQLAYSTVSETNKTVNMVNVGVSGTTYDAMITKQTADVFPTIVSGRGKYYVFPFEGTNQISSGTSAADTITKLTTYCNNLKANAAGKSVDLKIIVMPLLVRQFIGNDNAILRSGEFNVLLRDGYAAYADYYIDMQSPYTLWRADYESDAAFITAVRAAATNLTYFTDGTHLVDDNTNGYPFLARKVFDLIKTLEP